MTGSVLLPGCRERAWEPGEGYERCGGLWLPPSIVESAAPPVKPIAVGLFSGAGGMDLGFTQAGFHVAAASDGWSLAACTYLANLGGPHTLVHLIGDALPEGRKRETTWHAEHRGETVPAYELFEVCGIDTPPGDGWIAEQSDVAPCEHFYLGDICALTGAQILEDLTRTDTPWWQNAIALADAVCFVAGRVEFVSGDPAFRRRSRAGAPSCLLAYGDDCAAALLRSGLGACLVASDAAVRAQLDLWEHELDVERNGAAAS